MMVGGVALRHAVVARSDASEWEHIVDYPSRRRPSGETSGA